jgi:two-component system LytT family sensor kinase
VPPTADESPPLPRLSPWLILAAWTVPAVLSTFETVIFASASGHPIATWRAFAAEAPGWYVWAALTPIIVGLGQRFPLDRRARVRAIGMHLLASVLAGALVALVSASADAMLRPIGRPFLLSFRGWFLSGLPATTIAYFAVLGISYALFNTARLRARERHAEQLAAQLTEAQLSALKMQLHPHFLFNSLNAIMALVRDQDTRGAIRALALLSELLRSTLRAGSSQEIPLRAELEFTRRYLAMEQVRFGDRLCVEYEVPDDVLDLLVPTLILQPLVENAVRHGVTRARTGGRIEIGATRDHDGLHLVIRDDGAGLSRDGMPAALDGLGLPNTRARLAHMFGSSARLTVAPGAAHGVVATVTLPVRRAPAVLAPSSSRVSREAAPTG